MDLMETLSSLDIGALLLSLIGAVLAAAGTRIAAALSPLLRQTRLDRCVAQAVQAAEQLYPGAKRGAEKLRYVAGALSRQRVIKLDKSGSPTPEDQLRIEAAVRDLSAPGRADAPAAPAGGESRDPDPGLKLLLEADVKRISTSDLLPLFPREEDARYLD